jgi:hypothetical protein
MHATKLDIFLSANIYLIYLFMFHKWMAYFNFFTHSFRQPVLYKLCSFELLRCNERVYRFRMFLEPGTVAELSRVCTVFSRSEAGIVGLNPTQGMDI